MTQESPEVVIRELTTNDDLVALSRIFDDVWHPDPGNRPVSTDMLRALSHAGNYVAGAFVGGRLAGGSVAFFAAPVGEVLHSHITGVSHLGRGHRVGFALKMHQRDWARARGIGAITWTFDPLVARNAYFNIAKLGARPTRYYRDFYGDVGDELGGTDESDRVLMYWQLDDTSGSEPEAPDVSTLRAQGAAEAIDLTDPSHPRATGAVAAPETTVVVAVPADIEEMRRRHPLEASRWRSALRDGLSPLLAPAGAGVRPVRFLRTGHYVFGPEAATDTAGSVA